MKKRKKILYFFVDDSQTLFNLHEIYVLDPIVGVYYRVKSIYQSIHSLFRQG